MGTGTNANTGDGGPAVLAAQSNPMSLLMLPDGGFMAGGPACVRRVWPNGTITTVLGLCSTVGFSGDGQLGSTVTTRMNTVTGLASDNAGGWLFSEFNNHVLRRLRANGTVSTFAGLAGVTTPVTTATGGPVRDLRLNTPQGLLSDGTGGWCV